MFSKIIAKEKSFPLKKNRRCGRESAEARLTFIKFLANFFKPYITHKGPESILVEDDGQTLYTGTLDGKLVKIVNGSVAKQIALLNVENITCGTIANEKICGRPLGLRRLNAQFLLVADAYHGLFKG